MHTAANSSQPALPSSILLWYWGASHWFTLCSSAHLVISPPTGFPSRGLACVSLSFSLICFPVRQSKHCPSDMSVCLRVSFHLWRREWNAIWQKVGFTVCYHTCTPDLSSLSEQLFSSISDQQGQVKSWSEMIWCSPAATTHIVSQLTRTRRSNWFAGWQVWSTQNLNAECGYFPLRASSLRSSPDSFSTASTSELCLALKRAVTFFLKRSPSC